MSKVEMRYFAASQRTRLPFSKANDNGDLDYKLKETQHTRFRDLKIL